MSRHRGPSSPWTKKIRTVLSRRSNFRGILHLQSLAVAARMGRSRSTAATSHSATGHSCRRTPPRPNIAFFFFPDSKGHQPLDIRNRSESRSPSKVIAAGSSRREPTGAPGRPRHPLSGLTLRHGVNPPPCRSYAPYTVRWEELPHQSISDAFHLSPGCPAADKSHFTAGHRKQSLYICYTSGSPSPDW